MSWVNYFEQNKKDRADIPWHLGISVDETLRNPLIRSLQRFQIAESGDGVHMRQGAAATGNSEYAATIDLFLQEESVHSQTLDRVLTTLGAPLLKHHWSHGCFVIARRFMGLHVELGVILIAEMIAMRYYQVLHSGIADPVLHTIFGQMVHDETKHLELHCETLRRWLEQRPGLLQKVLHGSLWGFYQMAFMAVVFDHRELLRALGVTPGEFLRGCDSLFGEVCRRLFAKAEHTAPRVRPTQAHQTLL